MKTWRSERAGFAADRARTGRAALTGTWRTTIAWASLAAAGAFVLSTALPAQAQNPAPAAPVGEPPPEERRVEVPVASDVGGVLSPAGRLSFEPSLRFSHTSARRFTFRGVELVDTILLGAIEAEEATRNFVEASLTTRLGLTDRLEMSVRVPGVYRDDDVSFLIPGVIDPAESRSLDALGLGDVEASLHYQLNRIRPRSPIFVANLRGRFPTGTGPFEIERDSDGIETELPTGGGFYSVEPSLTMLYPADPVVFFVNVGYQWNIAEDVGTMIAGNRIGTVDPGDSVRASFGMGFAITDQTSISLGYAHDFIGKTETEINNTTLNSTRIQVGVLTIGFSHRFSPTVRADTSIELGATSEASDASVIFRLVTGFDLF